MAGRQEREREKTNRKEMNDCNKKKTNVREREKSPPFHTVHQEPMAGENPNADNSQGHAEGK
jgi:hypothetical protein